jgi:hypothetical protein
LYHPWGDEEYISQQKLSEKLKEIKYSGDFGVDMRIILKLKLEK